MPQPLLQCTRHRLAGLNLVAPACLQARRRGQLNANLVAGAAAASGYGSDSDVYKTAAAVDAAAGAAGGGGYDSDDAGVPAADAAAALCLGCCGLSASSV